jgi:hypothetical protein
MDAYIIIGIQSAGKSSVVRGLCGIRNEDKRLMATQFGTTFLLWAKDSSLQEASISPTDFIADVSTKKVNSVLLTLWPRSKRSREVLYPGPDLYIQAFQQAGWQIQPVAILDRGQMPNFVLPAGVKSNQFQNLPSMPFNSLVARVRSCWNWV